MTDAAAILDSTAPQTTPETEVAVDASAALQPPEKVSQTLSVLLQREKKALEMERRAKQRELEAETKYSSLSEREKRVQEFESLKSTNPMKALELLGLSYKDLTELAMNDGEVPDSVQVRKLKEEFEAFKKAQEDGSRQAIEIERRTSEQRETKILEDFKSSIQKTVEADSKKWELINFDGQSSMVFDIIDAHYNRTLNPETGIGEIMSTEDAADRVEKWLRETKYAKAHEVDFFKSKFQSSPTEARASNSGARGPSELKFETKPHPGYQAPRTLTNQLSATPAKPPTGMLTDDQRVAKAIAYARGLRP